MKKAKKGKKIKKIKKKDLKKIKGGRAPITVREIGATRLPGGTSNIVVRGGSQGFVRKFV